MNLDTPEEIEESKIRKLGKNIKKYRVQILAVVVGHALLKVFDFLFDNVLYPLVQIKYGVLWCWIIMTPLAAIVCLFYLWAYNRSKEDWLGINAINEIKENGHEWIERYHAKERGIIHKIFKPILIIPVWFFWLVVWFLKKGDVAAFFIISIFQDAFKTTAYLRKGRKGSLTKKDWAIFFSSIAVSNLYWTLRWGAIIEVVKWIIRVFI